MLKGSGDRNGDVGDGSGDSHDRLSKVFLEVELKNLNDSLPRIRRPLSELLSEQCPSYVAASGEHMIFDRGDLLALSKIVPAGKHLEIRLPIVIIKEAGSKEAYMQSMATMPRSRFWRSSLERTSLANTSSAQTFTSLASCTLRYSS